MVFKCDFNLIYSTDEDIFMKCSALNTRKCKISDLHAVSTRVDKRFRLQC